MCVRECVCVYERERECVCVRGGERECVCVRGGERECVCVCASVCVRKRERERVCVCVCQFHSLHKDHHVMKGFLLVSVTLRSDCAGSSFL